MLTKRQIKKDFDEFRAFYENEIHRIRQWLGETDKSISQLREEMAAEFVKRDRKCPDEANLFSGVDFGGVRLEKKPYPYMKLREFSKRLGINGFIGVKWCREHGLDYFQRVKGGNVWLVRSQAEAFLAKERRR